MGIGGGEWSQREAGEGFHAREPAAAGQEDRAAGRAWEQVAGLVFIQDVVGEDEDRTVSNGGSVEVGTVGEGFRDGGAAEAEPREEAAESDTRRKWAAVWLPHSDEQLAVGEVLRGRVRSTQGQRGLADASGSAQQYPPGLAIIPQLAQKGVLLDDPAGEVGHRGRQHAGSQPSGHRRSGSGVGAVEDLLVEVAQW